MKDNIKEDQQVKIIREKLLNDNALLQLVEDKSREEQCFARVRYITKIKGQNAVSETEIGPINLYGFFLNIEADTICYVGADENQIIEYNTTGLAYYVKKQKSLEEDNLHLEKLYDLKTHKFISNNSLEKDYKNLFHKSSKTKVYTYDF